MGVLLAFAPFIVFAMLNRFTGPEWGLLAGTVTAAILILRAWVKPEQSPKVLEVGTLILFGGLALYERLGHPDWSIIGVRLRVDAGLLIIVLVSMAIGRPFTLQYARERVAREFWNDPAFIRSNYVISGVWAVVFALLVIVEFALIYVPSLPHSVGIIAIVGLLAGAVKFTSWYPRRSHG